ncbi:MAG TPA: sulfurtransferase [Luteimonas sp.]|nr:sulfurtransferase [Luteimonas sp.]
MYTSIAAYRFVAVDDPAALADRIGHQARAARLLGSVIVAREGINLFLAGAADDIDGFVAWLRRDPRLTAILTRRSASSTRPFARLKVKVKAEIIAFRRDHGLPCAERAPVVAPVDLARWMARGVDDVGRRLLLLDTRNREEVAHGTFAGARSLPIDNFTELPDAVAARRTEFADATVVSFCTGGIRCEKAVSWMHGQGMDNVLQLDGGILGYFEAMGGAGFEGRCFVFDARIAVDPTLHALADAVCAPSDAVAHAA